MSNRDHLINGSWVPGKGDEFQSICPSTGDLVWAGTMATDEEVAAAIGAARKAAPSWAQTALESRMAFARRFAEDIEKRAEMHARLISREMGKPLWEARTEVAAVVGKIELTIQAIEERRQTLSLEMSGGHAVDAICTHGVLGVLGPFNLPAHLPNGHIVPALLAGNCVVFKPSDQTPAIAELMVDVWNSVGLPPGVLNLVQGRVETAKYLAYHPDLDGLLFTGSYRVGRELSRKYGEFPEKILALEMGGNNPLVVHECQDLDAAAYLTVQSAYITSGQRCTCARRLILVDGPPVEAFLERLQVWIDRITVGTFEQEPEPFMGPVVSNLAADQLIKAQASLLARGGVALREMRHDLTTPTLLTPGLIDMSDAQPSADEEWFGPLLQVTRVADWQQAIEAANATSYGLAAGLISDSQARYDDFRAQIRAGIVNWNRQTTGASGRLPFGGIGHSGNHRPSGFFAIDYCSYPVASLEFHQAEVPSELPPGLQQD